VDIVTKGLKKYFKQGEKTLVVLDGINVRFQQGKTYAITGVSGTGKSTLLHLLAGIDEPTAGSIEIDGKDLLSFSPKEKEDFFNQDIGLVFQSSYLISELTVLENVVIPGMIFGKSFSLCSERALYLLKELGVLEKAHSFPRELSGGQQQRVAIARALLNEPKFLLADEPTGNLDIKIGKEIVDLLLECSEKRSMGVIISSHDPYVAQSMGQKFKLENGNLSQL